MRAPHGPSLHIMVLTQTLLTFSFLLSNVAAVSQPPLGSGERRIALDSGPGHAAIALDSGPGGSIHHMAGANQATKLHSESEFSTEHVVSSKHPLMRKAQEALTEHTDVGFKHLLDERWRLEAQSLNNPFQALNETATQFVNATQSRIQEVKTLNSKSEVVKAMRVRLNGKGDTNALAASMIFSSFGCVVCFGAFYVLRQRYPILYAENGPAEYTVQTLPEEVAIKEVGLDAWMLMSFHSLAMKVIAGLGVLVLTLCPYHWSIKSSVDSDWLNRLSLTGVEEDSVVMWVHAGATYFVVLVTVQFMTQAKVVFTRLRYNWLQRMPAPQVTTLLIRGIPEEVCNDQALGQYFKNTFSAQAIIRAYVVRKTNMLEERLSHLEQLKRYALMKSRGQPHPATLPGSSGGQFQSIEIEELEVAAERARLTVAQHTYDPEVCSESGFVTFATRVDARRALHEQFGDDNHQFQLQEAPAPADVVFRSLADGRSILSELAGWCAIVGLFTAWAPLVLFVAGIMSLETLQNAFPSLGPLRVQQPWLAAVVDGIFATCALSGLMAMLPSMFYLIIYRFFRPVSAARSRLFLQQLYFSFQLVFVLLVTAIGQGFFTTLFYLAESPLGVLPLLARSLPAASHFYSAYIVMGWCACSFEMVRASTLAKYVGLQAFMDSERARKHAESMSDITGERYGKAALMFSVVLVFSSLSPLILVFGFVYFATCRVVHGYCCTFAEPRRSDLGGEFWVAALKQVHIGLIVYVLLMLGVLSSHGAGPMIMAFPALFIVLGALYNFDRRYVWQTLPLQAVAAADTMAASGEIPDTADASAYSQPECTMHEVADGMRRLSAVASRLSVHHAAAGDGLQAAPSSGSPQS